MRIASFGHPRVHSVQARANCAFPEFKVLGGHRKKAFPSAFGATSARRQEVFATWLSDNTCYLLICPLAQARRSSSWMFLLFGEPGAKIFVALLLRWDRELLVDNLDRELLGGPTGRGTIFVCWSLIVAGASLVRRIGKDSSPVVEFDQ